MEQKICDKSERMQKMIDTEKLRLVQELSMYKIDRMKEVQHVIYNIQQHAQFADSLATYMGELKNKGTASAVAQQIRALHDRANELMKLDHIQSEIKSFGCMEITFETAKIPREETGQWIGTIKRQSVTGYY
jgi:hypothetical protein